MAEGVSATDVVDSTYVECNLTGFQESKADSDSLTAEHFTTRSSLEKVMYDLLSTKNKELSDFLSNEDKLKEPDYSEQALEFFKDDARSAVECFRNAYEKNNVIYGFSKKTATGLVEGFAIVDGQNIKAVLYALVLTK